MGDQVGCADACGQDGHMERGIVRGIQTCTPGPVGAPQPLLALRLRLPLLPRPPLSPTNPSLHALWQQHCVAPRRAAPHL